MRQGARPARVEQRSTPSIDVSISSRKLRQRCKTGAEKSSTQSGVGGVFPAGHSHRANRRIQIARTRRTSHHRAIRGHRGAGGRVRHRRRQQGEPLGTLRNAHAFCSSSRCSWRWSSSISSRIAARIVGSADFAAHARIIHVLRCSLALPTPGMLALAFCGGLMWDCTAISDPRSKGTWILRFGWSILSSTLRWAR